jgi:hypothetical protein
MNNVLKKLHLRRSKLKPAKFQARWKELQKMLPHKDEWPFAVIKADKILDDALRKLHYKGKTTGERLVAAHELLSDVDGVWFGHKLRNKLVSENPPTLKSKDVKSALMGIGQALKDLGALE